MLWRTHGRGYVDRVGGVGPRKVVFRSFNPLGCSAISHCSCMKCRIRPNRDSIRIGQGLFRRMPLFDRECRIGYGGPTAGNANDLMSLTRRKILGSMGAAAIISASPPAVIACTSAAAKTVRVANPRLSGLACNMESWWLELEFMQRFEQAALAGFGAIEFWDYEKDGRDVAAVASLCRSLGLDVVQFTGWGDSSLAQTARHDEFSEAIKRAVDVAHQLDAPMFTVVGHKVAEDVDQAQSVANLERALERVVPTLEDAKKMLILEPFNPVDHLGFFLNGSVDALKICRSIDSPFVKINWDLYHMQLTEGNIVANMRDGLDQIGYVQIADVPGRHQPGTGELNYEFIFRALAEMGYTGSIGLECWPKDSDEEKAIADIFAARES